MISLLLPFWKYSECCLNDTFKNLDNNILTLIRYIFISRNVENDDDKNVYAFFILCRRKLYLKRQ